MGIASSLLESKLDQSVPSPVSETWILPHQTSLVSTPKFFPTSAFGSNETNSVLNQILNKDQV